MSAISLQTPDFTRNLSYGRRVHNKISSSWTKVSSTSKSRPPSKENELSEDLKLSIPETDIFNSINLKFDRLQQTDEEANGCDRAEFSHFVAREAQIDEEYWTSAWLRAEAHWEDKDDRYADNYKRKFAEQEFNALKVRCKVQLGEKCTCIVTVRKDDENVNCTVLKSVVGTLDLSIGYLSPGESFPGDRVKARVFGFIGTKTSSKYGYISNLCVAKSARRKGIARNMMIFATSHARKQGTEQVFVHVHRNNKSAQHLYHQLGFKVVEKASFSLSSDQTYLLCFEINHDVQAQFTGNNVDMRGHRGNSSI